MKLIIGAIFIAGMVFCGIAALVAFLFLLGVVGWWAIPLTVITLLIVKGVTG